MKTLVRRRGEKGLTLVELLISLALLSFVLLGIAPLFISSMKSNYSANEYTSVNVLARDKLEQLSNLSYTDARLSVGAHGNDQPPKLPDPKTGVPPGAATPGVQNPYSITYYVSQYAVPAPDAVPTPGGPTPAPLTPDPTIFTPVHVTAANQTVQYKRIDVTVQVSSGPLGIGSRMTRVTGFIDNPAPATNVSVSDPCGSPPCSPPATPTP
ncbi:MAG: prepilin-type N-terminal cleavage/methylation domain-containing protein [Acidobacteriota bacterium]